MSGCKTRRRGRRRHILRERSVLPEAAEPRLAGAFAGPTLRPPRRAALPMQRHGKRMATTLARKIPHRILKDRCAKGCRVHGTGHAAGADGPSERQRPAKREAGAFAGPSSAAATEGGPPDAADTEGGPPNTAARKRASIDGTWRGAIVHLFNLSTSS